MPHDPLPPHVVLRLTTMSEHLHALAKRKGMTHLFEFELFEIDQLARQALETSSERIADEALRKEKLLTERLNAANDRS